MDFLRILETFKSTPIQAQILVVAILIFFLLFLYYLCHNIYINSVILLFLLFSIKCCAKRHQIKLIIAIMIMLTYQPIAIVDSNTVVGNIRFADEKAVVNRSCSFYRSILSKDVNSKVCS